MSNQAPLTLHQLHDVIRPQTIDGQIGDVATMASIGLALLTFFTDRQANTLARLRADLTAYEAPEIKRQLLRDILLALLTAGGFGGLAPLVAPVLDGLALFQRSGSLRTLFLVVFLGYAALLAFQLSIVWRRSGRLGDKVGKGRIAALAHRAA